MKRFLHSLKFNLLWPIAVILFAIVISLTVIVSNTYTETLLRQEDAKTETAFIMISDAIRASAQEVEKLASRVLINPEVMKYSLNHFSSAIERVRARIQMLSSIEEMMNSLPWVYGIALVNEREEVFGKLQNRTYFFDDLKTSPLAGSIEEKIRRMPLQTSQWIGPFSGRELIGLKLERNYPENLLIYVWQTTKLTYGSFYLSIFVQPEMFLDHLQYAYDGFSSVSLLDEEGQLLCQLGKGSDYTVENLKILSENIKRDSFLQTHKSKQMYICSANVSGTPWLLMKEIPMEVYTRNIHQLRWTVWGVACSLLLLAILFYLFWAKQFIRTFNTLKDGIIRLRQGNLDTRLEQPFTINEFEDIRKEFNLMNQSLLDTLEEKSKLKRDQLELELRNLQTQLSPHMIFNSLTAIRWMSSINGSTQVADMLKELGEMLRPVFREWRIKWTLHEELEHLTHYSRLLKLRFGAKFTMQCDVPDEFMNMVLPRFTLQPLVENACEHGRKGFESLTVTVTAKQADDWLILSVWNNGKAITEDNLRRIREGFHNENAGTGIGIQNVYRRMLLCMGRDSKMEIDSSPEGGTQITMRWHVTDTEKVE